MKSWRLPISACRCALTAPAENISASRRTSITRTRNCRGRSSFFERFSESSSVGAIQSSTSARVVREDGPGIAESSICSCNFDPDENSHISRAKVAHEILDCLSECVVPVDWSGDLDRSNRSERFHISQRPCANRTKSERKNPYARQREPGQFRSPFYAASGRLRLRSTVVYGQCANTRQRHT